jgi:hypothetical protein
LHFYNNGWEVMRSSFVSIFTAWTLFDLLDSKVF